MDFFEFNGALPASVGRHDTEDFAKAIASRFGQPSMLSANLDIALPDSSPKLPRLSSHSPANSFKQIPVASLPLRDPDDTLLIDVRPPAQYGNGRLHGALSLSVPSIFLKRPLCNLQKITDLISNPNARERFAKWRESKRVLVYDSDSQSLPEGNNVLGLLRKFASEGYQGEICWLSGGFQAVWKSNRRAELIEVDKPVSDPDSDPDSLKIPAAVPMRPGTLASRRSNTPTSLPVAQQSLTLNASQMVNQPPVNPFFDTIRQNLELSQGITERIPLRLPRRVRRRIADLPFSWLRDIARGAMGVAREDSEEDEMSATDEEGSEIEWESEFEDKGKKAEQAVDEGMENLAMQFYRIELAEQRRLMGVMEHHSKESDGVKAEVKSQTSANAAPFPFSITAGVEKGAKNRYRHIWPFEHARVRLHPRSVYRKHNQHTRSKSLKHANPQSPKQLRSHASSSQLSSSSHAPSSQASSAQPSSSQISSSPQASSSQVASPSVQSFSPSEDGDGDDDYVNASYVQPLCTKRRYIATQGPLDATFDDFWTLVWQQNVHVIVMLTREIEGSMVKCGCYWTDSVRHFSNGRLKLELVSVEGEASPSAVKSDSYFIHSAQKTAPSPLIKRTFRLTHLGYENTVPPRKVVQLQYLEWPDMNVPEDPRGVLKLVKEVQRTVDEADFLSGETEVQIEEGTNKSLDRNTGIATHALGRRHSPVLLHCSAGVGRTGGFIAVDAVLDAVRNEVRKRKGKVDGDGDVVMGDVEAKSRRPTLPHVEPTARPLPTATVAILPHHGGDAMHVPVAHEGLGQRTPMQIDDKADFFGIVNRGKTAGTMKWAQEVSHEIASDTSQLRKESTEFDAVARREPPSSVDFTPSSSSSANSSAGSSSAEDTTNSSTSSLGLYLGDNGGRTTDTSVSSTPSIPKLLPAFAIEQNTNASRARTSSFPSGKEKPKMRTASPATGIGGMTLGSSPLVSSPWLGGESVASAAAPPARTVSPSQFDLSDQSGSSSGKDKSATTTTVDYKEPRQLHVDRSPEALSTFDEPLWEVVQDMREQRMSLCQSLRQYVFVHAAVIEGALQIVDEEKADVKGKGTGKGRKKRKTKANTVPGVTVQPPSRPVVPTSISYPPTAKHPHFQPGVASPLKSAPHLYLNASNMSSSASISSSTGKRVASPTELTKEDMKGEVALSKRPSIKRKQHSSDESDESFHPQRQQQRHGKLAGS